MLPLSPQPEPPHIRQAVAIKGWNILLELTGQPAPPRPGRRRKAVASTIRAIPVSVLDKDSNAIWRQALPDLKAQYSHTCAYLGIRITEIAHVDHFKPKSKYQELAYTWSNFRLSSPMVNSFKGEYDDVIDPFCVQPGWFELNLITGEVHPGKHLADANLIKSITQTIKRLKLNEYQPYVDQRIDFINRYYNFIDPFAPIDVPQINFAALSVDYPYIAAELRRLGKKLP